MSLRRNTLWNLTGAGLPFLVGVVTIPYLLNQVGVEAFGILTLIWGLIGYFSLFDFGLGRALTQQVAANLGAGLSEQVPSLIKTGFWFMAGTGLIGGIALAALSSPLGFKWLNISASLQQTTVESLLIASLGIPLTTVTTGLRGVLEAYEDFPAVNVLRILLGIANFGLPALSVIFLGPSLTMMVSTLIVARFLVFGAHLYCVSRKLPAHWYTTKFCSKDLSSLMSFGAWMTVTNIIGPLMVTADRFIISSIVGASLVAYYTVPFDTLIRLLIIPGAISAALFPRLTSILSADRRTAEILYRKSLKIVAVIMFAISLITAAGSYWILKLWIGEEFADSSWHITSLLGLGLLFNGIAHVPFAAIQAEGKARITAIIHLCEFILYVPVLFILLRYFGLVGAAIAWVVRAALDCFALLLFTNKLYLNSVVKQICLR